MTAIIILALILVVLALVWVGLVLRTICQLVSIEEWADRD